MTTAETIDRMETTNCKQAAEVAQLRARVRKLQSPEMAEVIATEILTVWSDDSDIECTRAQMMLDTNGAERNMGGRNKQSLTNCILVCLMPNQ